MTGRNRARALLGPGLLALALFDLAFEALRPDVPFSQSLEVARRAWGAPVSDRLGFAPLFAARPAFLEVVQAADAAWPLDRDVVLVLHEKTPRGEAMNMQRIAAYVLAPRHVALSFSFEAATRLVPVPARRLAP